MSLVAADAEPLFGCGHVVATGAVEDVLQVSLHDQARAPNVRGSFGQAQLNWHALGSRPASRSGCLVSHRRLENVDRTLCHPDHRAR